MDKKHSEAISDLLENFRRKAYCNGVCTALSELKEALLREEDIMKTATICRIIDDLIKIYGGGNEDEV